MAEAERFTYTETIRLDEILMPEPVQEADWWYNNFPGFDPEVYMLMENWSLKEQSDKETSELAKFCLGQRQNQLLRKFERGGRKRPYVEFVPFEQFDWQVGFDESVQAVLSS